MELVLLTRNLCFLYVQSKTIRFLRRDHTKGITYPMWYMQMTISAGTSDFSAALITFVEFSCKSDCWEEWLRRTRRVDCCLPRLSATA